MLLKLSPNDYGPFMVCSVKCRVSEIGLFQLVCCFLVVLKLDLNTRRSTCHTENWKNGLTTVDLLGLDAVASTAPETRANFFSKSKFWPSMGQVEV